MWTKKVNLTPRKSKTWKKLNIKVKKKPSIRHYKNKIRRIKEKIA